MALLTVQTLLADHPALRICLLNRGFERTSPSEYSNGRATVRFEGTKVVATPLDGSKTWRTDFGSVPPEAVVGALDAILATPPFRSNSARDEIAEQVHCAKIALDRIVEAIRESPESPSGRELHGFLWSLFNMHHDINLWHLRTTLDRQQSGWATGVFMACMAGDLSDEFLRRALNDSRNGEPAVNVDAVPAEQHRLGNSLE